jgi:hypothetical protein
MPLKLACADFSFPLLTHDQSLDLISMLKFDSVDVGAFRKRHPPSSVPRIEKPNNERTPPGREEHK